jgi:hypothetical protein
MGGTVNEIQDALSKVEATIGDIGKRSAIVDAADITPHAHVSGSAAQLQDVGIGMNAPAVDARASWERRFLLQGSPHSSSTAVPQSPGPSRCSDPGDNELDRPYPYEHAMWIPMQEVGCAATSLIPSRSMPRGRLTPLSMQILEDGLPPIPRAIAAQRSFDLLVMIWEAHNMPPSNVEENQEMWGVELRWSTYEKDHVRTDVRRGSDKVSFYQQFSITISRELIIQTREARYSPLPNLGASCSQIADQTLLQELQLV